VEISVVFGHCVLLYQHAGFLLEEVTVEWWYPAGDVKSSSS